MLKRHPGEGTLVCLLGPVLETLKIDYLDIIFIFFMICWRYEFNFDYFLIFFAFTCMLYWCPGKTIVLWLASAHLGSLCWSAFYVFFFLFKFFWLRDMHVLMKLHYIWSMVQLFWRHLHRSCLESAWSESPSQWVVAFPVLLLICHVLLKT